MEFVENLPRIIKIQIQISIYKDILVKLDYFKAGVINQDFIFEVCNYMKSQVYDKNIVILSFGQLCEEIFFVFKGSLLVYLDEKYENYPLSKLIAGKSFGENIINERKPSLYNIKTNDRRNEIISLSKDNYEKIKIKFPIEVSTCDSKSKFVFSLIEELRKGAYIYFELHATLKNYKQFSMKLINTQIDREFNYFSVSLNKKSSKRLVNKFKNTDPKLNQCIIPSKKNEKNFKFDAKNLLEITDDLEFHNKAEKLKSIKQIIRTKTLFEPKPKSTTFDKNNTLRDKVLAVSTSSNLAQVQTRRSNREKLENYKIVKKFNEDKNLTYLEKNITSRNNKQTLIFGSNTTAERLNNNRHIIFIEDSCAMNYYNSEKHNKKPKGYINNTVLSNYNNVSSSPNDFQKYFMNITKDNFKNEREKNILDKSKFTNVDLSKIKPHLNIKTNSLRKKNH